MKRLGYFTILILFLLPATFVDCALFSITDPVNDVKHYQNTTLSGTGDYHDEIDIVGFEVNTNQLKMLFEGTPIDDSDHLYNMVIFWDGDEDSLNRTVCQIGGGIISLVATYLYDSNEIAVAINSATNVVTTTIDSVETPIPAFNLIQDPSNPQYINVHSAYIEVPNSEYFMDNLTDSGTLSGNTGFNAGIISCGLSFTLVLIALIRKKR